MIFNGVNSHDLGVTCLPQAGCWLSQRDDQAVSIPGMDGQIWVSSVQKPRTFPVKLVVSGSTAQDTLLKLDTIAGWLSSGPAQLIFDESPDRYWTARLDSDLTLVSDRKTNRVSQDITMIADDPHPYALIDDTTTIAGASATVTRSKGNAPSWPVIKVTGTLTATQSVTLTLWGQQVTITGPLTSTEVAVLDYGEYVFTIQNTSGTVLRNLAGKLSTLARVSCPVGGGPVSRTVTGGTITQIQVACRSRWL